MSFYGHFRADAARYFVIVYIYSLIACTILFCRLATFLQYRNTSAVCSLTSEHLTHCLHLHLCVYVLYILLLFLLVVILVNSFSLS